MSAEAWHERWREGRIGFHLAEVNPNLRANCARLTQRSQRPRVLVPLCGKSLDMWYLAEQGFAPVGVELSPIAAEALFAEHGKTPQRDRVGAFERYRTDGVELLCGDVFDTSAETVGQIDACYDRAALIALPPDVRQRYAAHLTQLLPSGAPLLLITIDYDQQSMSGPPFSVPQQEVASLFSANFAIEPLSDEDGLGPNSPMRGRGVNTLREQTQLLLRH